MLTPAEFSYALEDFEETHYRPAKNICETLRLHGQIVYNSAFGRKKTDLLSDPKSLFKFIWEQNTGKVKVSSSEEMKNQLQAIARAFGAKPGRSKRV